MRKNRKIIFPLFILTLISCGSFQFEKQPPFTIIEGTYTHWVGGIPGVSGTNINITYKADVEIQFDSIFFKDKKTKVSFKNYNNQTSILGQFMNKSDDLQLHEESKMEYGNTVPEDLRYTNPFPFKLDDNEVVLSYIEDNKTKYFKYSELVKGKRIVTQ